ncbi:putative non-specific serine/threonine protein kinase [Rosa chinensis]|uniref:Putative non-specific serine/threonine protein kinase n=1 Tax=Rosa chinensis TaxID=74649 RepID=A0A2P6SN20_ROSCH|nr:putative non-specific serine/threonine protein kinase [Rosa chinensis]
MSITTVGFKYCPPDLEVKGLRLTSVESRRTQLPTSVFYQEKKLNSGSLLLTEALVLEDMLEFAITDRIHNVRRQPPNYSLSVMASPATRSSPASSLLRFQSKIPKPTIQKIKFNYLQLKSISIFLFLMRLGEDNREEGKKSRVDACGNFGSYNSKNGLVCKCLLGFKPSSPDNWNHGDYSSGCTRKFQCFRLESDESDSKGI